MPSFLKSTLETPLLGLSEPVMYNGLLLILVSDQKPYSSHLTPNDFSYFQNLKSTSRTKAVHYSNDLCAVSPPVRLKNMAMQTIFMLLLTSLCQHSAWYAVDLQLIIGEWMNEWSEDLSERFFFDSTNTCLVPLSPKSIKIHMKKKSLSSLRSFKSRGGKKLKGEKKQLFIVNSSVTGTYII